MPFAEQLINDGLPGDPFDRRLAGGVNFGYEDCRGVVKRAPKFCLQRLCPREAMRLKHDDHARASRVLRGGKGGAHFAGMMRVIIDDHVAV